MAKTKKMTKEEAIKIAKQNGVDFCADFHGQTIGDLMAELAKKTGYKKPANANGSTGRYFFNNLAKKAKC